ncbi:MAG TPA: alpha/beta fold hydrolase [Aggregatilinea sp.]|uniref:alpha/beta hydrolase family protein n=1 Tax=Aggregatilinea sp. TaxID=2806333 RepID=UPI002C51556D|nr:alpha/beta fold hydrolase [Aggregatilinea sp.]HML21722.1 alpha/beta fold hydrolase [Aggregatilinea sp.]
MSRIDPVEITGRLGTLRGLLHRPDAAAAAPVVVMLHGFTGQHVEQDRLFVQAARVFAQAGLAVLRFDFYGSGDSDGDFEEFTVQTELDDAVTALDWISAQPGIDPARLGVLGLSLGGCVASLLAGQDPRVKALVLWNAVSIPSLHFGEIPTEGPDALILGGQRISIEFLSDFYGLDVTGTLQNYAGPGLVVRGTADDVVPLPEAEALAATLGDRGELFLVKDAGHTFQHPDWRALVFQKSTDWLCAHLGGSA